MVVLQSENPACSICEVCGHEQWYTFSPMFPSSDPDDERDGVLYLEDAGRSPLEVARLLRELDGLDSPSALRIAKMKKVEIGRRIFPRVWQLSQLEEKLIEAGAKTRLDRIFFDNK